MTLVLLCGSLEPGADGVGDYCRRLAAAFTRLGVTTRLIALHDPFADSPRHESQCSDGVSLNVYRLPSGSGWRSRASLVQERLRDWHCSVLSLQFVPYAYHPRGFPLGLLYLFRKLSEWPDLQIHLMFHEIWIGIGEISDVRSRFVGHLQRRLVQVLHTIARPFAVHVTNGAYACCLRRAGIQAIRLPLYSNLDSSLAERYSFDSPYYTACIFGRIPPLWDPDPALAFLVGEAARQGLKPRLLLLGHHWASSQWFLALRQRWPNLEIIEHGIESSSVQVCRLISTCQLGLATVPWSLVEKSGAVAAFLSLGLPVLVSRDDWHLRQRWSRGENPDLVDYRNLFRLSSLCQGAPDPSWPVYTPSSPRQVALAFLDALAASQARALSS